jgi:ResB-like family protein
MDRVWKALGSLRLTIWLLLALLGLFLLGLAVPQRAVLAQPLYEAWRAGSPRLVAALEWLQLTDVHTSWIAYLTWAAFFLNLAVVIGKRAPGTLRRARLDGPLPAPGDTRGWPGQATLPAASPAALEQAAAALAAAGLWVRRQDDRVLAVRHRWSPLATIAFHASFFLILAGGILSVLTRFEADVRLAEGERFTGALQQYERRPRMPRWGDIPHEPFTVERILPGMEGRTATSIRVELSDEGGVVHQVGINTPYRIGNRDFVVRDLGVAPLLVVRGPGGEELDGAWVKLDVLMGKRDRFVLAGLGFEADYFPDHVTDGGADASRSEEFRNPLLRLTVRSPEGPLGQVRLRPGETARIGGVSLAFQAQRYWVRFLVRKESGVPLVWAGLALACAALCVRLGLYRREYLVVHDAAAGALGVAGRAEYYRALFEDEFEATVARLRSATLSAAPASQATTPESASGSQGSRTP